MNKEWNEIMLPYCSDCSKTIRNNAAAECGFCEAYICDNCSDEHEKDCWGLEEEKTVDEEMEWYLEFVGVNG